MYACFSLSSLPREASESKLYALRVNSWNLSHGIFCSVSASNAMSSRDKFPKKMSWDALRMLAYDVFSGGEKVYASRSSFVFFDINFRKTASAVLCPKLHADVAKLTSLWSFWRVRKFSIWSPGL